MKKHLGYCLAVLWMVLPASSLYARGGGGCLEQGTPIDTPSGPVAVEKLKPGDRALGVAANRPTVVTVVSITRVQPDEYYELMVDDHTLRVTAEHPVETAPGVFQTGESLRAGDTVVVRQGNVFKTAAIRSITRVRASLPAHNLLVSPAGSYVANGIVVHNKGCFLPETPIRKADGTAVPISRIRRHDHVLAFTSDGRVVSATVKKVLARDADEYLVVKTGAMTLHVTAEHPFYVGNGTFKTLEALKAGDVVFAFDGKGLGRQRIESIETIRSKIRVYNLQTNAPNTFFADGIAVHNKGGGCFPAGTLIKTPGGNIPIERFRAGDPVLSIDENNRPVVSLVGETHATRSPVLTIHTEHGTLRTTEEHPLALASGDFRPAGQLVPLDKVVIWREDGALSTTVTGLETATVEIDVYNLTVDRPHTFLADGFVVHNKGGGGGGSYHGGGYRSSSSGSGGSDDGSVIVLVVIIGVVVVVLFMIIYKQQQEKENLDYVYTPSEIAKKGDKTVKLLAFISKQDPSIAPETLRKMTEAAFLKLQECWQSREYTPMKPLLMPDLYADHLSQIQGMVRDHEIDVLDGLKIDRIDLVNVRYTLKEEQREFTALITATARDYYIDDRTKVQTRGDKEPAQFQEFWTFQYMNKTWLVREIEQTRESDALKEENFFEQVTDKGIEQIYGEPVSSTGPAGPWLEKSVGVKETRIERMLNFLVKTDRIWDRKTMLLTARRLFLEMTAAWESGDPASVPTGECFPEIAEDLRAHLAKNRDAGITLEFRNLCVRKVELVLVKNFDDNSKDEFVARIRAHAQKCIRRKGALVRQDDDVTPFEQHLTFGRLDSRWKLKEVLNANEAQGLVSQENVDQESSPQQLRWYYQHKRAL